MTVDAVALVICGVLALPAGWFACTLFDRIPEDDPLFAPVAPVRVHGRYLAIHLVTLGGFVAMAWRFGDASWWVLGPYLILVTSSVALGAIDLDRLRLPDRIVVPTLILSLLLIVVASLVLGDAVAIQRALIGLITYFGFLFVFHLIFGNRGMGFGDVKMSAILGLYLGWLAVDGGQAAIYVLWAMIIGVFGGALIGIVLFILRGRSRSYPFGPFLIAGTFVMILWGRAILPG